MKRKGMNLVMVALVGLLFLTVGVLNAVGAAEKAQQVPKEIKIENEGYAADKKGPVILSHEKHVKEYGAKCTDCHHVYKDGKNVWKEGDPVKKCNACHDPEKKQGDIDKLQNAFHKNCKDCHKEAAKKDPNTKAPFKKCNDCHQKKS